MVFSFLQEHDILTGMNDELQTPGAAETASAVVPETTKTVLPKKISVKLFISIIVVLLLAGLGYYYKGVFVVAAIDGHPISRLSVVKRLEKQAGKTTLDTMIDDTLVNNAAKAKGITVSDSDIDSELKKIEAQVTAQGLTLDAALQSQGFTLDMLKDQIAQQKKVEALLGDALTISDADVDSYIKDNQLTLPTDPKDADAYKSQIKDQMRGDKFNQAAPKLLSDLRAAAHIRYFVKY